MYEITSLPGSCLVEVPLDGLGEVLVGDVPAGGSVHEGGVGGPRVGALVLDPVVDVLGAHVELAVAVGSLMLLVEIIRIWLQLTLFVQADTSGW